MADAKLEFSVGSLSFSAEGDDTWLAAQLDKLLEAVPGLVVIPAPGEVAGSDTPGSSPGSSEPFSTTLASYIREKDGESNQVQRFLATADWLRRRGKKELTTSEVSKALSSNQQKRLSNPSDSLNKNIAKGYCEKKGNGFFITPDGLKHLGSE